MAANKKPRKQRRYVPRPALPIVFRHDAESETALQLAPHLSLANFRMGIAEEPDWHTLAARLNVGSVAAHKHDQMEAYALIEQSLDAIRSIKARNQRTGAWGINGDELKLIGEALYLTDELQKALTRRQMAECIDYVFQNAGVA